MFRNPRNDPGEMFYDKAEEERCKRYERRQYRNLVLKALLTFVLGLLISYFLKL